MAELDRTLSADKLPVQHLFSVGLTGGIGSGKSTVADLFALAGVPIIDTDSIAHALTGVGGAAMPAIRQSFGNSFISADGALERNRMRAAIFHDPALKNALEAILHPMIARQADQMAQALQTRNTIYLIFAVPLLVQSQRWRARVDRILVVDCPEAAQQQRVMQRSSMSAAQVGAIMAAQSTRSERLAAADDVIDNSGEATLLSAQVTRLHTEYLREARLVTGDLP